MMLLNKNILYLFSLLYLFSCTKPGNNITHNVNNPQVEDEVDLKVSEEKIDPAGYINWIENPSNGLVQEKVIGDLSFMFQYKTPEYLAIRELENDSISNDKYSSAVKEYDGMQYFSFKIQSLNTQEELLKKGITVSDQYYSRIEYCSFKMQNDFKLIDQRDTFPCKLFHFERVYGLSPSLTFVLGFPKGKSITATKTLLYQDNLFNTGNIYMQVKKKDLVQIPQLSI